MVLGITRCSGSGKTTLAAKPLLASHIAALARGEVIERPLYDFSTHTRVPGQTEAIHPTKFLIVEGLFTLIYPDLLRLYQAQDRHRCPR